MSGSEPVPHVAPPVSLPPAHRRMILGETIISMAINAFGPAVIIWMLDIRAPATLGDQAAMLGRATVLATFLMSFIVTALVRGRVAKGFPALERPTGLAWVPRLLPLRALLWTACALVSVLPAGLLAGQAFGLGGMGRLGFFGFNVFFGALLGLALTPFVVWLSLTDKRKKAVLF